MRLDKAGVFESSPWVVRQEIDAENNGGGENELSRRIERCDQQDKVVAVVRALDLPLVVLPCDLELRVTSVPRVRAGEYRSLADRGPGQEIVARDCGVVLEKDVDGQGFREQHVGGHAVDIPCIPAVRQVMLQGLVLDVGLSWSGALGGLRLGACRADGDCGNSENPQGLQNRMSRCSSHADHCMVIRRGRSPPGNSGTITGGMHVEILHM